MIFIFDIYMVLLYNLEVKRVRQRSLIQMADYEAVIQKVIQRRIMEPTQQEAEAILRRCGIIDSHNKVISAYSKIVITPRKKNHESK